MGFNSAFKGLISVYHEFLLNVIAFNGVKPAHFVNKYFCTCNYYICRRTLGSENNIIQVLRQKEKHCSFSGARVEITTRLRLYWTSYVYKCRSFITGRENRRPRQKYVHLSEIYQRWVTSIGRENRLGNNMVLYWKSDRSESLITSRLIVQISDVRFQLWCKLDLRSFRILRFKVPKEHRSQTGVTRIKSVINCWTSFKSGSFAVGRQKKTLTVCLFVSFVFGFFLHAYFWNV